MPPALKTFLKIWLVNTVAVLVAAQIVQGIRYENFAALAVAALLLGILNAFLRPILMILSLPLLIVTLGLFTFVINALLLYFVGWALKNFQVDTFGAAFWGGLIISLVALVGNKLVGVETKKQVRIRTTSGRPPHPPLPPGQGPIIDV